MVHDSKRILSSSPRDGSSTRPPIYYMNRWNNGTNICRGEKKIKARTTSIFFRSKICRITAKGNKYHYNFIIYYHAFVSYETRSDFFLILLEPFFFFNVFYKYIEKQTRRILFAIRIRCSFWNAPTVIF